MLIASGSIALLPKGGRFASALVLLGLLSLLSASPTRAQSSVLSVESSGKLERIPLLELEGRRMVPLAPLCRVLEIEPSVDLEGGTIRLRGSAGSAVLSPGSARVLFGSLFLPLSSPPRLVRGEVFVPPDFLPRVAAFLVGRRIDLQPSRATVSKDAPEPVREPLEPLSPKPVLTVVLDPGHGGKDGGAIGKSGLAEKEVALEVCLAVQRRLEKDPSFRVVLTRSDDSFLELAERTAVANERGDCFVSVHLNSGGREGARGFEVYSMSPRASDKAALAASRFENQVGTVTDIPQGLQPVLWDIAHNDYVNESAVFAETMVSTLSDLFSEDNRGAKQAPFLVLAGATVPAILVEIAFISHAEQEAALRTPEYRETIADAVAAGITAYLERYRNKYGGASGAP